MDSSNMEIMDFPQMDTIAGKKKIGIEEKRWPR